MAVNYTQEITLDINANSAYTTIAAKQGDTGTRDILVHLTQNNLEYRVDPSHSVFFRCRKPDGKAVMLDATVITEGTNTGAVIITLDAETLRVAGRAYADIVEYDSSASIEADSEVPILSTASFILLIMASPNIGPDAISSNEFGYLMKVVNDAENIIHEAEAWARGTRAGTPDEDREHDNAKYYSEVAATSAIGLSQLTVGAEDTTGSAYVTKTYDSAGNLYHFQFGLPQGIQGKKGDRGASTVWVGATPTDDDEVTVWLNTAGTNTPVYATADQIFYAGESTYNSGTIGYAMYNMERLEGDITEAVEEAQAAASAANSAVALIDGFEEQVIALQSNIDTKITNPTLPSEGQGFLFVNRERQNIDFPTFTYTGLYTTQLDSNGNWQINFWESGTLTIQDWGNNNSIDICAVGGGGGGGGAYGYISEISSRALPGGHGGGGNVVTKPNQPLLSTTETYYISIGAGGSVGNSSNTQSTLPVSGVDGGVTSLTIYGETENIISANGGEGGKAANANAAGANGQPTAQARLFGDTEVWVSGGGANATTSGGGGQRSQATLENNTVVITTGSNGYSGQLSIRNSYEKVTEYSWREEIIYDTDINVDSLPQINNKTLIGNLSLDAIGAAPSTGSTYYYHKAAGGIPGSDLDQQVQNSLTAANGAVQIIRLNGEDRRPDDQNRIDLGSFLTDESLAKTNFVDNSWFLVNQRGVTAFNGSNQPLATVGTYIYDRWVVLEDEGNQNRSIVTNEGMLHISAADPIDPTKSFVLGQYINDESWKMLSAKPIIASISYSLDGEVFATRELKTICPIYDSSSYITNQPYQIQLVENSGWGIAIKINEADGKKYLTYCLLWYGNGWNPTTTTDSDVYVNKVKLEVGDDTNTLGYDLPPSYSDELLKCQKYFMYYGGKPAATSQVVFLGQGIADTSTKIDWAVPINQPMISTPHIAASVSLEGRKGFTSSTNAFTIASDALASSTIFEGINSLYVTTTITGATAGSAYIINLPATATVDEGATETISYISFSAEPVPTIPTTGS